MLSEQWRSDVAGVLGAYAETQTKIMVQAAQENQKGCCDEAAAQQVNCEAQFMMGLQELGKKMALIAADELIGLTRGYLNCKFGGGPQAQAAGTEVANIIKKCALDNWRLLLTGGWAAYAAAVARCAVSGLLGGLGGGLGPAPGGQGGPQLRPAPRCS